VAAIEDVDEHPVELPRRPPSRGWRALRYASVTGAIGAIAVVAAAQTGGVHWSFKAASWVVFGFCFGAVFGPLFALARDDGRDEVIAQGQHPVHGQSDTSTEGAQAHDLRRSDRPD
jgi:hypothetical protein